MKQTPSNCDLDQCAYNAISPPENSQECIGCPYLINENWQPTIINTPNTPNTPEAQDLKIYEVNNRQTGEKSYQAATTADDACKQAGWLIGDCFIVEQTPRRKPVPDHNTIPLVKIPCLTCPFQYAECIKPADQDCITRPKAPELQDWLRQATEAHLCPFVGKSLTKKDYQLNQKWLPLQQAIKELSPKSPPTTDNTP